MEDNKTTHQNQIELTNSNIIFGTSSDDIEQGLHNQLFIDDSLTGATDDKDQIVNEQEQNEIVNPSEETFNEELAPPVTAIDTVPANEPQDTSLNQDEEITEEEPEKTGLDSSEKLTRAED